MSVVTPNMFLTEPTVGTNGTLSPSWALLLNANFGVIDQHNHTTGMGVPIPPAGLDINSDLSFQGNNILAVNSLVYNGAVTGTPAVLSTYTNGTDLFYKDADGNSIQLTSGGSPASATGNIQGLPSTPTGGASITWVNAQSTFKMIADSGTVTANVDMGTAILRYPGSYPTPSGNYIALKAPTTLATGYSLTFPATTPASQKFMTMDGSGNIAAPWAVDNSTVEIASSTTLQVKDAGITAAKLATDSVITAKIQNEAVTRPKISAFAPQFSSTISVSMTGTGIIANSSVSITTTGKGVWIELQPTTGSIGGWNLSQNGTGPLARITMQLDRAASLLTQFPLGIGTTGATYPTTNRLPFSSIRFYDSGPVGSPGTYSYRLQLAFIDSGTTMTMADCRMMVYEAI